VPYLTFPVVEKIIPIMVEGTNFVNTHMLVKAFNGISRSCNIFHLIATHPEFAMQYKFIRLDYFEAERFCDHLGVGTKSNNFFLQKDYARKLLNNELTLQNKKYYISNECFYRNNIDFSTLNKFDTHHEDIISERNKKTGKTGKTGTIEAIAAMTAISAVIAVGIKYY
jgi:hypothetical protein